MKKKIMVSADGESLCRLARIWYRNKDFSYEKIEKFLLTFLDNDELSLSEKKEICKEILEGKKILKGVNEFDLVDDEEN